nr:protein CHUP1, chloroplastic [Tanacetum cinerariifolium]
AQLLEYSRLKEQETTVRELQSRLKLNSMESKLLTLKVESLQTENKRLVSQTADYNKVLSDLEAARAKIKLLKKKLLSETAQNKERILGLQQRVQNMQEDERKGSVGISLEIESNLCKSKDLEAEAEELRKSNNSLTVEKAELLHKLQRAHMMDTIVQHRIHHRDRSHSRNSSPQDILSYSSKHSMDSQRLICMRSDVGAHKGIDSIAETVGSLDSPSSSDGQKSELVKFAEVLKDSNQKPTIKVRRRSKGFVSF